MLEIQNPFGIKGIPLKPEMKGRLKVDETLIQSLAAIMGFDGQARRLITCALSGSLNTVSPAVSVFLYIEGSGGMDELTFADMPTTEILIHANSANTSGMWIQVNAVAAINDGWQLKPGDWIKFSIDNMNLLSILVITDGDKAQIIRTV